MNLIWWLLIGLAAGWLASLMMKTRKRSLGSNLLLGVIGSVVGGFLLGLLGLFTNGSVIGSLVSATIGAVVVIWLVNYFSRD